MASATVPGCLCKAISHINALAPISMVVMLFSNSKIQRKKITKQAYEIKLFI